MYTLECMLCGGILFSPKKELFYATIWVNLTLNGRSLALHEVTVKANIEKKNLE